MNFSPHASTSKAVNPANNRRTVALSNIPTPTASLTDVHLLVQHVARSFFESKHIVLLDQLIRGELALLSVSLNTLQHRVSLQYRMMSMLHNIKPELNLLLALPQCTNSLKDEVLATKLGVQLKDLNKIAQPLLDQRLLAVYRRNEVKDGAQKAVARAWFYLDFKIFIDVVKWRMYKVRKTIDDKLRDEIKSQGYDCPLCKKTFSTLDVLHLEVDPVTSGFKCDVCGSNLGDNESAAEAELGKTKIRRLLEQCKQVMDGLKKTELLVIPAFDIKKWLDINHPVQESASLTHVGADGIKISTGGGQVANVKIELADEQNLQAMRQAKEKESEATRAQNALPSWIAKSTVSGAQNGAGTKDALGDTIMEAQNGSSSPMKEVSDDGALEAYYAKLQNSTAEAIHPPTVPALQADLDGDSDPDDLFETVENTTDRVLTPMTYHEDESTSNKLLNVNGKRSREPSIHNVELMEADEPMKRVEVDGSVKTKSNMQLNAEVSADSEEEDLEFEEVGS